MRSAQPLVTSSSKRKYEDEQYLRNIQQIALSKEGKIFDTRSTSTISSHTRRVGDCTRDLRLAYSGLTNPH